MASLRLQGLGSTILAQAGREGWARALAMPFNPGQGVCTPGRHPSLLHFPHLNRGPGVEGSEKPVPANSLEVKTGAPNVFIKTTQTNPKNISFGYGTEKTPLNSPKSSPHGKPHSIPTTEGSSTDYYTCSVTIMLTPPRPVWGWGGRKS